MKILREIKKRISLVVNLRHVLFSVLLILAIVTTGIYVFKEKRGANGPGTPKAAALHLSHDDININNDSGQAVSGYVIPKAVINNDFTLRLSIKASEYDMLKGEILSIEGNGTDTDSGCYISSGDYRKRLFVWYDSSPISHFQIHSRTCNSEGYGGNGPQPEGYYTAPAHPPSSYGPNSYGERLSAGTRAIETYEDYFVVYKKPIPGVDGQNGYFRIYRNIDANTSIIPQGWDYQKPNGDYYYNYIIDKDVDYDWHGNDTLFRLVVGNENSKSQDLGNGLIAGGQDFDISELTMWTSALDSDMTQSGTYSAQYERHSPSNFNKYSSLLLNNLTQRALSNLDASYKNNLYFHFGDSDEGLSANTWVNNAANAPANINLIYSGVSSLTSKVPAWPGRNYPAASTTPPVVDPASFSVNVLNQSSINVSNIPIGVAQENATGLPVKRIVYVSTSAENYKYNTKHKEVLSDNATSLTINNLDLSNYQYFVTIEWVDRLENMTKVSATVNNEIVSTPSADSQSVHLNSDLGSRYAFTPIPYKLPVNQTSTFRVVFKLIDAPNIYKSTYIFGIFDRLSTTTPYRPFLVSAHNNGTNTKIQFSMMDGSKYFDFNSAESTQAALFDPEKSTITVGQWEEFWFTLVKPTISSPGGLIVYRYNRITNSLESVYNNTTILPVTTSWFSDWNFKKHETRIFLGDYTNTSTNGANFLVNQMSWWNKALSNGEISSMAGNNIDKLESSLISKDSLFWTNTPTISGSTVSGSKGTSAGIYDLNPRCQLPVLNESGNVVSVSETNCLASSDVPTFLNSNEGSISLSMPTSSASDGFFHTYANRSLSFAPTVSNATTYQWTSTGPGNVTFGSATSSTTTVSFDTVGTHTLTLTASDDSGHTAGRSVTVKVHKFADINGDNSIDSKDFYILFGSWGTIKNALIDLKQDETNTIDSSDFFLFMSRWGQ